MQCVIAWIYCILNESNFDFALHENWIQLMFSNSQEQNCNVSSHWNRLFFTVMWLLFFNRRPAWILVSRRSFMQKNLGFLQHQHYRNIFNILKQKIILIEFNQKFKLTLLITHLVMTTNKIKTFVEREFKMFQHIFNSVDISSCRQHPAGVYEKQPEIKIFSVFHSFFINLIEKHCCTLLRWNVVNALQCSKIELCTTSFGWAYHHSYCKGNTSKFFFFCVRYLLQKRHVKKPFTFKREYSLQKCYAMLYGRLMLGLAINSFSLNPYETHIWQKKMSFRSKIHLARK